MVLKRVDFGKCGKSPETRLNVAYMLANGFLTVLGLVLEDSVRIPKGPKSADFEQKPWAFEEWEFCVRVWFRTSPKNRNGFAGT